MWSYIQRFLALCIFLGLAPILSLCALAVWLHDRRVPLYTPVRVGKDGIFFRMFKLRTMCLEAEKKGGVATASNDPRITPIGKWLRRYKLDEFLQLVNVIKGDMLLIGPRPQLISEYESFTENEKKIVSVPPGMSDISSLILSKMEGLLASYKDPYEAYFTLCRPVKSRLALFYIKNRSLTTDLYLLFLNATNFISHKWTLRRLAQWIVSVGDSDVPYDVLTGETPLYPRDLP